MRMARFRPVVSHVPGKDIFTADHLSRSRLPFAEHDVEAAAEVDCPVFGADWRSQSTVASGYYR